MDFYNCSLGDAGTKSLTQSICWSIETHNTVNTYLLMWLELNGIHEEGASYVAELLNSTSIVSTLWQIQLLVIKDYGLYMMLCSKQNVETPWCPKLWYD